MTNLWHAQIQRYMHGQASAEEAAALQEAMKENADLRALYLDYLNLDEALGAAAEAALLPEDDAGDTPQPRRSARSRRHYWRWLAGAAACAALAAAATLVGRRPLEQTNSDVDAACASIQEAVTRLSIEQPAAFPSWTSPTASVLDQPRLPKWDL